MSSKTFICPPTNVDVRESRRLEQLENALVSLSQRLKKEKEQLATLTQKQGRKPVTEGNKFDNGKDPWHLLPTDAVKGIVKVLGFGAAKYAERNWEKGMSWSRVYSALLRHLTAWFEGEKKDSETGYSHLWHAGCCILFLISYEIRNIGNDDRPINKEKDIEPQPIPGTSVNYSDLSRSVQDTLPGIKVSWRGWGGSGKGGQGTP